MFEVKIFNLQSTHRITLTNFAIRSVNLDGMENYDNIYDFLYSGIYPDCFSKNQKRVLRRKAKNFKVCDSKHILVKKKSS